MRERDHHGVREPPVTNNSTGGGLRRSGEDATGCETQRQRRQVEGSPPLFGLVERVGDGPKRSGGE